MLRKTDLVKHLILLLVASSSIRAQTSSDTSGAHLDWSRAGTELRKSNFQECQAALLQAADQFRLAGFRGRALECDLLRAESISRSGRLQESQTLIDTINAQMLQFEDDDIADKYRLAAICIGVENIPNQSEKRSLLNFGLELIDKGNLSQTALAASLEHLWGLYYFDTEVLDSSAAFLERALAKAQSARDDYLIGRITLQWGKVLRRMGDHAKAADLIRQGISSYQAYYGPIHTVIATGYNDLAINLKQLGQLDAAGENFAKALDIRAQLHGKRSNAYARILNNAALQFLDAGDLSTALRHAEETVRIFESLPYPDKRFHLASHNTLAKVLSTMGKLEAAAIEYRKALEMHRLAYPGSSRARYYLISLGNNALDRKRPSEALVHFHEAMAITLNGVDPQNVHDIPSRDDPSNFQSLKTLCLLKAQAWLALYNESMDTSKLRSAIQLFDLADHFAAKNRTESRYQKSRLAYSRQNLSLYQGAIEANVRMYGHTQDPLDLDQAFLFAEKSKSLTLLEDLLEANALRTSGIPEEYLLREQMLQDSLADLRSTLIKANANQDSVLIAEKLHERIALEISFDAFKKQLESEFPRFYQSKFDFDFQGIEDIKQLLKAEETAISYFVGKDKIFRFLIASNRAEVAMIPRPDSLNSWIERFRQAITEYDPSLPIQSTARTRNLNQYKRLGQVLFNTLLGDLQQRLTPRLMIIPDDVLNYVPFGALLTESVHTVDKLMDLPFLDTKHCISYNYSGTLAEQMTTQPGTDKATLLAVAPSFDGTSSDADRAALAPLLFNEMEAKSILDIWPGEVILGNDATESAFRQRLPQYGIIHLATHALVNEGNSDLSFLAFAADDDDSQYLYLQQLYNMDLPVHLVTLSACETSLGPLQQGEGIASLAQGFSYAGAKSIVTSLWEVEDGAAARLLSAFYDHLSQGKDKAEALQAAKIDYRSNSEDQLAHPFYWAAFIPIGDMTNLEVPSANLVLYGSVLALILISLLLFSQRKTLFNINS